MFGSKIFRAIVNMFYPQHNGPWVDIEPLVLYPAETLRVIVDNGASLRVQPDQTGFVIIGGKTRITSTARLSLADANTDTLTVGVLRGATAVRLFNQSDEPGKMLIGPDEDCDPTGDRVLLVTKLESTLSSLTDDIDVTTVDPTICMDITVPWGTRVIVLRVAG